MSDTDDGTRQPTYKLCMICSQSNVYIAVSLPVVFSPNSLVVLCCAVLCCGVCPVDPLLASSSSRAARYNKKKSRSSNTSPLQSFRTILSSTLGSMINLPTLTSPTASHDTINSATTHTQLLLTPPSSAAASATALANLRSRRYLLGLFYLAIVIFLWVASSALIQWIFEQQESSGAFFLTYFSTSLFTLYLPSYYTMQACIRAQYFPRLFPLPATADSHHSAASSSTAAASTASASPPAVVPFTLRQHFQLAMLLSPIWFLMEYLYNESLSLTSLSQNTILSTTSGVFVLLFNWLFFRDPLTLLNLLGVGFTFAGAYLVYHDGAVAEEDAGAKDSVLGDVLAVSAAVFYGLYTVVVKWKVKEEGQVNWQLVLGLLGAINFAVYWPLFPILQATNVEPFPSPSTTILLSLLLNGLLGTVLADYLWARSILLTSPLVATMGLTLNIPCSLLVEWVWKGRQYGFVYAVGGLSVVAGFVMVNWKEREADKEKHSEETREEEGQQLDEHEEDEAVTAGDAGLRELGGVGLEAELVNGVKRASGGVLDEQPTAASNALDGSQISRHDLQEEFAYSNVDTSRTISRKEH